MASLTLFEPRDFDFTDGYLASQAIVIPLRQKIEIGAYGCGQLLFRLHSGSVPLNASVQVLLVDAAPTDQDPQLKFQDNLVGTAAFQAGGSTPVSGVSLAMGLVHFRSPYVAAYLVVLQPSAKDPTFKVTLSADLTLKDGFDLWTPASLGPKLWLDDRGQTASGGLVSGWADNSGNANDFTAGSPGQPASAGRINGVPSPRFDGINDVMSSTAPLSNIIGTPSYHGFAVVNPLVLTAFNADPSTNAQVICDGGSGYWGLYISTLGVQAWQHDSGTTAYATPTTSVPANIWNLIEWSYDGTTIRCRVGGRPATSINAPNVGNVAGTLQLGHGWSGSAFFVGTIGTILVFSGIVGAADVQSIRTYLSSKYGVPA